MDFLKETNKKFASTSNAYVYPEGTSLSGMPFDPANGSVGKYSPDVMIPAFLATYAGGDAQTTGLNLFPSMLSMLPNWRVTYSGLGKLEMFKKYFKSVNINHSENQFGLYFEFSWKFF